MPQSRAQIRWRTLTIILAVLLLMAVVTLIMTIAIATSYDKKLPGSVADEVLDKLPPRPTVTVTPGQDPAPPPDLADQVAVAWSVATGWPNSEKWGEILYFTSYQDDLLVHTSLTEPADMTEVCNLLLQLNDPVLAIDPPIDQVLLTGTDGQVIWSCVSDAQVQ